MKFKVTWWPKEQESKNVFVEALNHKDALGKSVLVKPGEEFTVDGNHATVRYKTDSKGRISELSRYSY